MKVKLKKVISYEVISQSGESLGTFIKQSEWQGMADLRCGSESLIVDLPHEFSFFQQPEQDAFVVKASPGLANLLEKEKPEFPPPAPQPEKC